MAVPWCPQGLTTDGSSLHTSQGLSSDWPFLLQTQEALHLTSLPHSRQIAEVSPLAALPAKKVLAGSERLSTRAGASTQKLCALEPSKSVLWCEPLGYCEKVLPLTALPSSPPGESQTQPWSGFWGFWSERLRAVLLGLQSGQSTGSWVPSERCALRKACHLPAALHLSEFPDMHTHFEAVTASCPAQPFLRLLTRVGG